MDLFFICICLCHIVLSVSCSIRVTCWERAVFLALLYVACCCVFVTFPYGVLGQVWYLTESIPDLCIFLNFEKFKPCAPVTCDVDPYPTSQIT